MSRQLDWYNRNRDKINAKRRKAGKADVKRKADINSDSKPLGKSKTIRLHALALLKPLSQQLTQQQIQTKLKQLEILFRLAEPSGIPMVFFQYKGFNGRLTTKSMTLWALQKEAPRSLGTVKMLDDEAKAELRIIFHEFEKLFEFKDEERIIERHIAFTNDEFAQYTESQDNKVLIKINGKDRFLIDFSNGVPEAEFIHAQFSIEDSKRYEMMLTEIMVENAWQNMKETMQLVVQEQKIQQQFFKKHNELISNMSKLIKELREEKRQRI